MIFPKAILLLALIYAGNGTAYADPLFEYYAESPYAYCDAEALAALWETDVYDAKTTIGYKLKHGWFDMLVELMDEAHENARVKNQECLNFNEPTIEQLEENAYGDQYDAYDYDHGYDYMDAHWMAWEKSGYSYCDAKVLAGYWGETIDDSKMRLGDKLYNGTWDESELYAAREKMMANNQRCSLVEGGFAMEDAKRLAEFWGVDPKEGLERAETKLTMGGSYLMWDMLKVAGMDKKSQKKWKKAQKKEAKRMRKLEKKGMGTKIW